MKKILLVLLALLLTACSPVTRAAPASEPAVRAETVMGQASAASVTPVPPTKAAPPTATAAPTGTPTPAPSPAPSAAAFTEPVVLDRYPMVMNDNLGFPSTLLTLPGGQAWETTGAGGVRVYDSAAMKVVKSLDLGIKNKLFTRLVGDEQYVWALFFAPMEGTDAAKLFRISRADFSYQPVSLPGSCTYDACLWSFLLIDQNVVWVGGYDELIGIDRETLQPVTRFLFSEQAQTVLPAQVQDMEVTDDGQVWVLFCTDICYIVLLDRQKLLDSAEQKPPKIFFENNSLQFLVRVSETIWAGEASGGNVDPQPAVLYPLSKEDVGADLSPADGVELPAGLDFLELSGQGHLSDGTCLWVRDVGGRKLFWFDPVQRKVAGVLQVYLGDQPTAQDPKVVLSISFDGQYLWGGGVEIIRIAIPWIDR